MKLTACRYDTGAAVTLSCAGAAIQDITAAPADQCPPGLLVGPGLFDLQVNGYGGQEFNDLNLNEDQVAQISLAMDADGVTSYLPTATTHSFEMLQHTMQVLARAWNQVPEVSARVPGFHLEGPYLSPQDGPRGAHPREHIRPPDWDEFQRLQEAAGGLIRLLTISPEYDEAAEFIAKAARSGVVVSIGHTAADSDQIQAAADAGARLSTHLGNGAHGQIRRHPNYIWDQLADDRLTACLIADGHHLPDSVLKSFVRAKTPARCAIVSDITGLGGMPPGRYDSTSIGAVEVLEDGRLVVAGQRQYLAGAALPLRRGVPHLMHAAQLDLATALELATTRPAELLGQQPVRLMPGSTADLIVFRLPDTPGGSLQIEATIKHGEQVFQAAAQG